MSTFGLALLVLGCTECWAAFPPLCVEISPEHPLLVFEAPAGQDLDAAGYAEHIIHLWNQLDARLSPFSVVQISSRGPDVDARRGRYRAILEVLQDAGVPVVIRVADSDLRGVYPVSVVEELVREFTCVKGIQAVGLPFEEYYAFGEYDALGTPPVVRWLIEAIDVGARYGRFTLLELDRIRWPRVMSNVWCEGLYAKIRECADYVVPVAQYRGQHCIAQISSLLGLWLEGAVANWGVGPQSHWYEDARFKEPGVFGISQEAGAMPPSVYRAMILNGAMQGATVYSFAPSSDLWFGAASKYWGEAIRPTLLEVLGGGFIARRDFVEKKTRVAYQLAPSETAQDFHLNLRDIDGVLDKGFLIQGAYGMERPGQVPELVPNTGRHFWVPLLSAFRPPNAPLPFDAIVRPAEQTSAEGWRQLLDEHYEPDGEGTAFIARIGRGVFVMHTCENRYEPQTFRIPSIPAAVARFQVKRQENGILVTWPFREGDFSYKVFRRVPPATDWEMIAEHLDAREFLDTTADAAQAVAYTVTALTSEEASYEGVVDFGDYQVLSVVESRIAEEAVLSPLLTMADSQPLRPDRVAPVGLAPWWPDYTGLTEEQMPHARAIVGRIEAWDRAFGQEDLSGVLDLYSTDYQDPEGWAFGYVRRAYKWFFEHYNACTMHRQIRGWDFSGYETLRQVRVQLYCRFEGYALTDPAGRFADCPAHFPRNDTSEVWVHFSDKTGPWRIVRTDPALPNFKDILSFSASPFDNVSPGPDQ